MVLGWLLAHSMRLLATASMPLGDVPLCEGRLIWSFALRVLRSITYYYAIFLCTVGEPAFHFRGSGAEILPAR